MRTPIKLPSLSPNQIRNNILDTSGTLQSEEDQWVGKIKESFSRQLGYTKVHKNLDETDIYESLIYDGNKDDEVLGSYKEFLSYPYNPHQFEIGDYISFDYGGDVHDWLITTLDKHLYYNIHGRIERCNIALKWANECGEIISYPAVAKDEITDDKPHYNENIITNSGDVPILVQFNDSTKNIKINQRFLLGEPYQAFKVVSITNYTDTNTVGFNLRIDNIAPDDDLINGVANAHQYKYTISIEQGSSLSQTVGQNTTLSAIVKCNDSIISVPVTWESSDTNICTIDSNGNLSSIAEGTCTITAKLTDANFVGTTYLFKSNLNIENGNISVIDKDSGNAVFLYDDNKNLIVASDMCPNNQDISATITINVSQSITDDTYEIVVSPSVTKLLQNQSQTYNIILYKNGIVQYDTFTYELSGVPTGYYAFIGNDNSFTVTNLRMYSLLPLSIKCISGEHNKTFNIDLKGAW